MQQLKTRFYSVLYEHGSVRQIKSGNTEILRMIYSAVRDWNWGTLIPEILHEDIQMDESGFQLKTIVRYKHNSIHFEAEYVITGSGNRLVFEMAGEAKSTFKTNRTGICVLHPIKECAGNTCLVFHPNGTSENSVFPEQISPHQPMKNIAGLVWKPAENLQAKVNFSGDIFEMEDQRNWTDASYKTYCRPLDLPFPYEIKKGEKVHQKIELEIETEAIAADKKNSVFFHINYSEKYKFPKIGVSETSRRVPLSKTEAEILNRFAFDHLRAEIHLVENNWQFELAKSTAESNRLSVPLFLVLSFSADFKNELNQFKKAVRNIPIFIKYILIVHNNHLPDDEIFDVVYPELKLLFPNVKIGTGVNAYFAELNRNRPQTQKTEFIGFTICPQVHAFDNLSLVENLEGQKHVVESAKKLFPGKPVFISPVTLKQRLNVVATSNAPKPKAGELPSQVDTRQNTVFAAQWLLGSLKFLTQSGADLITCFENVDWRGFIQGDFEPSVPEKFSAQKEDVFPVFELLKEFDGFDEVMFSESSSPLEVDGIVLKAKTDSGKTVFKKVLTNFTSSSKKVRIEDLNPGENATQLFHSAKLSIQHKIIDLPPNEIVIIEEMI